jgi:hypothetical protein
MKRGRLLSIKAADESRQEMKQLESLNRLAMTMVMRTLL